jgi:Na+-driven multidrug efflux pump
MQKIAKYFSWIIACLYFVLGTFVLVSDRFQGMSKELRIVFSIFLFLYGGFRLVRLWSKNREDSEN